jgi:mono/diheme cytochrome c family protein
VRRASLWLAGVLLAFVAAAAVAAIVLVRHGVSARDEPTRVELLLARAMRRLAIPSAVRARANPVPATPEALARARAHFADHCASCHGNDGKGRTTLGRNLYPKAPDMTEPATQRLSDGELHAIIENGVRLTGMPAWGSLGPQDDAETWELVLFIRRLPSLTAAELEEMKDLNPKTRRELEEEEEIRRFLSGADSPR